MRSHFSRGVTLLELAMVLLIIAALTAILTVGLEVVRTAQTRAIIAESDRYIAAIKAFSDKFNQLPGDFTKATTMWGTDTAGGGCPNNTFSSTAKRATCDGDGDGAIGSCCPAGGQQEWYRSWQHLANAGLLDGSFSGIGGFVTPAQLRIASVPRSSYSGGSYTLRYSVNNALSAEEFVYPPGNWLHIGKLAAACDGSADPADCIAHTALLLTKDAIDIDTKVDDGMPGSGRIIAPPSTSALNPSCTTTTNPLTSTYNIVNTQISCALMINTGF